VIDPRLGAIRTAPPVRIAADIRGPFRVGLIVIVLLFGVLGTWAATARLSGAVIANGAISPEGSRQTVQHLEGGIIRTILARDGDRVAKGDELIVIEDLPRQADLAALRSQLFSLAAQQQRLMAERAGSVELVFDDPALADRSNREIADVTDRERSQFIARRSNDALRAGILAQKIAQSKRQIEAHEQQLQGLRIQRNLIREELEAVRELVQKGLERKPRLLALLRSDADNVGRQGALLANIAEAEEAIAGIKLQMADLKAQRAEDLDSTLADVTTKRRQIEEQIRKSHDQVARASVRAPVSGTVFNSRFKTPGGVIRPGEPILDVVPDSQELIIEARLSAKDVDEVHQNQPAHIVFPAFPQRHMQRIRGEVMTVSADALPDDKSNQGYYTVKVKIDTDHLHEVAPKAVLEPGMPAEVFIATGERTVLNYLTHPPQVALERSMKER
jgi:HlyD family type I secretion membrane fusion protein